MVSKLSFQEKESLLKMMVFILQPLYLKDYFDLSEAEGLTRYSPKKGIKPEIDSAVFEEESYIIDVLSNVEFVSRSEKDLIRIHFRGGETLAGVVDENGVPTLLDGGYIL